MTEDLFYLIAYSAFGFCILPLSISVYLSIIKRPSNTLVTVIALVEFVTGLGNIGLYKLGFNDFKLQYDIYYSLEIFCWMYILYSLQIKRMYLKFGVIFILAIILLSVSFSKFTLGLEISSKVLQFTLGFLLLFSKIDKLKNKRSVKLSFEFFLSIGLMQYSLIAINLIIFKDILLMINESSFNLAWNAHQVSSIFYFILLSISVWKSQRI